MAKTREREVDIEDDDDLDGGDQTDKRQNAVDEDDAARKSREAVFGKSDQEDDDFEVEEDARIAYDEDTGERSEGPSRRQRRNRARRERRNQDASLIAAQNERIQRLEGAIAQMGQGQLALHAGGIDAQIAEAQGHLEQVDAVIAKGVADADGVRVAKAMKLRDEATFRIQQLGMERRRLEGIARQQGQPQQSRPQVEVDPEAARYSDIFMDRHPWFDPRDNSHEDSQMVKAIDDTLVNEGYKPNTARYWRELERRVEARGLGKDEDVNDSYDDDDYGDEPPRRGAARRKAQERGGLPPRSRRGGGGEGRREATFDERRLPKLAKDTLEQLGLLDKNGLDENQLKEREGYIKQWRIGLKAAADRGERV